MMRVSLSVAALTLFAFASSSTAACTVSAPHSAEFEATDIRTVRIVSGAGALNVLGTTDDEHVSIEGDACASGRGLLDEIRLDVERRGDTLIVTAVTPSTGFLQTARLDLDVRLPNRVAVEVEDGSGDVAVADVAAVTLRDGSGDASLRGIRGDVRVDDDGSGHLSATDVGGDVTVVDDGSGDLLFRRIAGSVVVHDDGSGGITAETIGGDFVVEDAGSGAVRYSGVEGDVRVPRD